jgi:hypothetical protein
MSTIWKYYTKSTYIVATLALGSRARQKGLKGMGQEGCENEDSHSQVNFPFRSWSPSGLSNLQRAIAEVKTPRIEKFFISLERYWSVDVKNGLAWPVWTSVTQVIAKRKAGSQIGNLTLDHKKSGIDPTSVRADEVKYIVGNLWMKATTLL